jgi:sec-independent protein translocase protein TatA
MNIFGIGLPEMAVIAAIALIVFGPKRLPEMGKTLGRTLKGFQTASREFEDEFRTALRTPEDESLVSPSPPSLGQTLAQPVALAATGDTSGAAAALDDGNDGDGGIGEVAEVGEPQPMPAAAPVSPPPAA